MITRHFSTLQYKKLFKINFLHKFYQDGKSKDFEVRPTEETKRFLMNNKLLLRDIDGGVVVLFPANRDIPFIKEDLCFSFVVMNKNSFLTHFSDLPFDVNSGKIYHFCNWNKEEEEGEEQRLTASKFIGTEDRIIFTPQFFQYDFEEVKEGDKLTVTNDFGKEIYQNQLGENPEQKQDIDLRNEPLGKYHLSINKEKVLTFYTSDKHTHKGFGMIDICVKNDIDAKFSIWDASTKTITPQDFVVRFSERKTYWRYYFIKRKEKVDFRDYQIVHTHHEPDFLPPESISLQNGTSAIRMESKYPISLKERLEGMYQLKVKKNGKGLNTSLNLPTPPVRMVKPGNTTKVYSDMYVYL